MPFGEGLLPTLTLNHSLRRLDLGRFLFLYFHGYGLHGRGVPLSPSSDYFHCEVFVFAVGVERAVEYVHYVGHDFEVLEGFYCAPGRV